MASQPTHIDNIIIGAGPAGLQLAYFFHVYGQPYVAIEKGAGCGTFFTQYPRNRKLISYNKVYCGEPLDVQSDFRLRFDWNSLLTENGYEPFSNTSMDMFPSAQNMVDYLEAFRQKYNLNVVQNTRVLSVRHCENGGFLLSVQTQDQTPVLYSCNKLFVATGVTPKTTPRYLHQVAESVGATLSSYESMSMDLDAYKNKHVCVVGSGNAAFEVATHLNQVAAGVMLVGPAKAGWRSHYPGYLRSINMSLIDTFYLKVNNAWYIPHDGGNHEVSSHVCLHLHNDLIKWAGRGHVDHIIYCGGFQWCHDVFDNACKPSVHETSSFPHVDDTYQSVNIHGLYFVGTLMQGSDYKKGSSTFIHGFRYNIRFLAQMLCDRLQTKQLGTQEEAFAHALHRLNNSSCLTLRYEFYCDVLAFNDDGTFTYLQDIPISYAKQKSTLYTRYWIIYMGYASEFEWNFQQREFYHPRDAHMCVFLHPIIQYFNDGTWEDDLHIGESPTLQFSDPAAHVMPLRMFFDYACNRRKDRASLNYDIKCIQLPPILETHPFTPE